MSRNSLPRNSISSCCTAGRIRMVSAGKAASPRSEEHTSELQSQSNLVCRLLLEKKKKHTRTHIRDFPNHHTLTIRPENNRDVSASARCAQLVLLRSSVHVPCSILTSHRLQAYIH